jgi:hypothetical protein
MAKFFFSCKRNVIVLFGGLRMKSYQQPRTYYNEIWEWDGKAWTKSTAEGPGSREGAGFTYDEERNVCILFGGIGEGKFLGDTWSWDGKKWTKLGDTGPIKRSPAAMGYDPGIKKIILYGGHIVSEEMMKNFDDTWQWDGKTWTEIQTSQSPGQRTNSGFVYHTSLKQLMLFGGGGKPNEVMNDLWIFTNNEWRKSPIESDISRSAFSWAFYSKDNQVILMGGIDKPGEKQNNDTWVLDSKQWKCVDGCIK